MATLRDAIRIAQQEPDSERSLALEQAIMAGKFDTQASEEGIDLTAFKGAAGGEATQVTTVETPEVAAAETVEIEAPEAVEEPKKPGILGALKGAARVIPGVAAAQDVKAIAQQEDVLAEPEELPTTRKGEVIIKNIDDIRQLDITDEQKEELAKSLIREKTTKFIPGIEFQTGALKGAANTITGGTELTAGAAATLFDKLGLDKVANSIRDDVGRIRTFKEAELVPKTPEEKVGFAVEQVAEFFVPGGVAGKAGKIPAATKGLKALTQKIAREGVEFGGVTALQEGELNKDVALSAILAMAFPAAGAAGAPILEPVKRTLTQQLPSKLMNSLIKPGAKEFRFGKDPGGAVAKEGIVGRSIDELFKKITAKKKQLGTEIGESAAKAKERTNADNLIDDFLRENKDRIEDKLLDEGGQKRFARVIERLKSKDISDLNGKELHELQRRLGNLTQWTGSPFEKEVNQLLAGLYRRLGTRLETVSPGTKNLQRRFANLLSAEKAAERRVSRTAAANVLLGFSPQILGASGAGIAVLSGDKPLDSLGIGLITALATKGAGSTAVKSNIAKQLTQFEGKKLTPEIIKGMKAVLSEAGTSLTPE